MLTPPLMLLPLQHMEMKEFISGTNDSSPRGPGYRDPGYRPNDEGQVEPYQNLCPYARYPDLGPLVITGCKKKKKKGQRSWKRCHRGWCWRSFFFFKGIHVLLTVTHDKLFKRHGKARCQRPCSSKRSEENYGIWRDITRVTAQLQKKYFLSLISLMLVLQKRVMETCDVVVKERPLCALFQHGSSGLSGLGVVVAQPRSRLHKPPRPLRSTPECFGAGWLSVCSGKTHLIHNE